MDAKINCLQALWMDGGFCGEGKVELNLSSHFGKSPGSVHLRHSYSKYANAFQILIPCYRRLLIGDFFLESIA